MALCCNVTLRKISTKTSGKEIWLMTIKPSLRLRIYSCSDIQSILRPLCHPNFRATLVNSSIFQSLKIFTPTRTIKVLNKEYVSIILAANRAAQTSSAQDTLPVLLIPSFYPICFVFCMPSSRDTIIASQ
jgi:hypothetical protein